jgi:regulator of replication initiation timing
MITRITNLFKKTNIQISFRTNNNISSSNRNTKSTNNSLENSGIYEMKFHICNLSYIGQTDVQI